MSIKIRRIKREVTGNVVFINMDLLPSYMAHKIPRHNFQLQLDKAIKAGASPSTVVFYYNPTTGRFTSSYRGRNGSNVQVKIEHFEQEDSSVTFFNRRVKIKNLQELKEVVDALKNNNCRETYNCVHNKRHLSRRDNQDQWETYDVYVVVDSHLQINIYMNPIGRCVDRDSSWVVNKQELLKLYK